jgi:hypothetical protein
MMVNSLSSYVTTDTGASWNKCSKYKRMVNRRALISKASSKDIKLDHNGANIHPE